MTARDRLIHEMTHNHLYMTDEQANELVDDLLHEEAEKIRQERDAANVPGSPLTPEAVRGMTHAADLVDPKAR